MIQLGVGDLESLVSRRIVDAVLTRHYLRLTLDDGVIIEFSSSESALPMISIIQPRKICH